MIKKLKQRAQAIYDYIFFLLVALALIFLLVASFTSGTMVIK